MTIRFFLLAAMLAAVALAVIALAPGARGQAAKSKTRAGKAKQAAPAAENSETTAALDQDWFTITNPASSSGPSINALFIGNSFTGRHTLSQVVKAMAEAGQPGLTFHVSTVLYGGRTLSDHWRLGTQNAVRITTLTPAEGQATIAELEAALAKNPQDGFARQAIPRQRALVEALGTKFRPWDVVILQSYRDDLSSGGAVSRYAEYAPKFAELIKAQGGRVVLYETTPLTQNDKPLTAPPDPGPVMEKARAIAALANQLDAAVAPMSFIALRCQTERPDLTLRFVNDGHLNQTMAYLTACTLYAALFDRSPEGLPIDRVTDIRFLDDANKDKDRDGGPLTRVIAEKDRADLQRIAWEGLKEFGKLRESVGKP